ncbi:MAG: hypothetical protein AAGK74_02875 [Chloroflexota bacterium]
MVVAVVDADEAVVTIIEYAAARYGATTGAFNDLNDLVAACPDLVFIETRHPLYHPDVIDAIHTMCPVPVTIVALDTMTGFNDSAPLTDIVLPKPFSAADLSQIMDQLFAV